MKRRNAQKEICKIPDNAIVVPPCDHGRASNKKKALDAAVEKILSKCRQKKTIISITYCRSQTKMAPLLAAAVGPSIQRPQLMTCLLPLQSIYISALEIDSSSIGCYALDSLHLLYYPSFSVEKDDICPFFISSSFFFVLTDGVYTFAIIQYVSSCPPIECMHSGWPKPCLLIFASPFQLTRQSQGEKDLYVSNYLLGMLSFA